MNIWIYNSFNFSYGNINLNYQCSNLIIYICMVLKLNKIKFNHFLSKSILDWSIPLILTLFEINYEIVSKSIKFQILNSRKQIQLELHEPHKGLCYEYKNATLLEEANAQNVVIWCGWYSFRVVDEVGFLKLKIWFSFWHFCVRQWKRFMKHIKF